VISDLPDNLEARIVYARCLYKVFSPTLLNQLRPEAPLDTRLRLKEKYYKQL
jgi:hypothetical protein